MRLLFTALACLISVSTLLCQEIKCEELIDFVEYKGYLMQTNNAPMLTNWLGNVSAYSMVEEDPTLFKVSDIINQYKSSGKYVIIAEIINSNRLNGSLKYIFCEVPIDKWEKFNSPFHLVYSSRGEKFHELIMNYKCNCN